MRTPFAAANRAACIKKSTIKAILFLPSQARCVCEQAAGKGCKKTATHCVKFAGTEKSEVFALQIRPNPQLLEIHHAYLLMQIGSSNLHVTSAVWSHACCLATCAPNSQGPAAYTLSFSV
jgi:hypothetical protein